jgi:hypothetical protein
VVIFLKIVKKNYWYPHKICKKSKGDKLKENTRKLFIRNFKKRKICLGFELVSKNNSVESLG